MNVIVSNRERLLAAARELFLEQGYDASVDAIICRAEVARQTFYNHFKSKESLFGEVVMDCFLDVLAPLNEVTDDLRQSLKNFAHIYRQKALSPEGIASYRTLSGQSQRFPELVREAYALGAGKMIVRLADFLGRAMTQGQIRHADPVFAAELLIAMILGQERTQLLLGVPRAPEDEALKVDAVVDGFLKMFAPGSPESTK
jgi:AcrR family transcriptional regulator